MQNKNRQKCVFFYLKFLKNNLVQFNNIFKIILNHKSLKI